MYCPKFSPKCCSVSENNFSSKNYKTNVAYVGATLVPIAVPLNWRKYLLSKKVVIFFNYAQTFNDKVFRKSRLNSIAMSVNPIGNGL
jgi:hypothetical protein